MSGDTSSPALSATGSTSEWLTVRVTENDNSLVGKALKLSASLTSPPGEPFDLNLYVNKSQDVAQCTSATASSSNGSASISWGEGALANGQNDSRTVVIEVLATTATCPASQEWSLSVHGN